MKSKWEIRQVDAIAYDDGWTYNESYHLGVMKTSSKHLHRAFTHWLRNTRGIQFGKGTIRIEDQGDLLEIQERKSGRPLFIAIYQGGVKMKTLLFTYDVEEILNGTGGETCMEITMADAAAKEILEGGYNRHVVEIIRHNEYLKGRLWSGDIKDVREA